MRVTCDACDVESRVPDDATAYRCKNCGTLLSIKPDGTTRRPFEPMKIILPALVLILFAACFAVQTSS
jgi:hypothetical protein